MVNANIFQDILQKKFLLPYGPSEEQNTPPLALCLPVHPRKDFFFIFKTKLTEDKMKQTDI